MNLINENDPLLRKMCEPQDFTQDEDLDPIISRMFNVMEENNGVGLAAPQIGVDKRLFTMAHEGRKFVCFNPEIFDFSGDLIVYNEGCLSFPGLRLKVKRPDQITCRWYDEEGVERQDRINKLWSRIFQHELDHLNGILFIDRVSKLKLDMAKKKRMKHYGIK